MRVADPATAPRQPTSLHVDVLHKRLRPPAIAQVYIADFSRGVLHFVATRSVTFRHRPSRSSHPVAGLPAARSELRDGARGTEWKGGESYGERTCRGDLCTVARPD